MVTFSSYGGSVRFKPTAGKIASDGTITNGTTGEYSFKYELRHGAYTSPPATVTVFVQNNIPVAEKGVQLFEVAAGTTKHFARATFTTSADVIDLDGDAVGMVTAELNRTNVSFTTDKGGTVWMNWQTGFSYKPPPRRADGSLWEGYDSFDYALWDKAGFTDTIKAFVKVGNPSESENPFSTTTQLSGESSAAYGRSVTFTATVTARDSSAGTPTGNVTFKDGDSVLGTGTLSNGVATFSSSSLTVGSHTIKASYSGQGQFTSSTGTATQSVDPAPSTVTVTGPSNSVAFGDAFTVTARVTAATSSGAVFGTVNFFEGAAFLGSGTLEPDGTVSIEVAPLGVGNHTVTARYAGDLNHDTSEGTGSVKVVPVVSVGVIDDTAVEDGIDGKFKVSRTGGTQDDLWVTLEIGGEATNGEDYDYISTQVHFLQGQADYFITLKAITDDKVEGSESVTLALVNPVGPLLPFVLAQAPPAAAKVDDRFLMAGLFYSGTKQVDVYRDDTAGATPIMYKSPLGDWVDADFAKPDGKADKTSDYRVPVAFVRDSQLSVKVEIGVNAAAAAALQGLANLKIRGTGPKSGPDDMVFEAAAEVTKNLVRRDVIRFKNNAAVAATDGKPMPTAVKLPNTVMDYPSFTIMWEVFDGQKWVAVGTTENHLYVTYDTPQAGVVTYESLLDIGVRNATGKATDKDIVDAIWSGFNDLTKPVTRKAMDGRNTADGAGMAYWMDRNPVWTEAQYRALNRQFTDTRNTMVKLLNPKKDTFPLPGGGGDVDITNVGTCEAWSELYLSVLRSVGLGVGTRLKVTPNNAVFGVGNVSDYGFLLKGWTFAAAPKSPVADGIFNYTLFDDVTPTPLLVEPGQVTKKPPAVFDAHFVVKITLGDNTSQIYDPSYGKVFADERSWEEGSIIGYYKMGAAGSDPRVVKNDANVAQVDFTPANV